MFEIIRYYEGYMCCCDAAICLFNNKYYFVDIDLEQLDSEEDILRYIMDYFAGVDNLEQFAYDNVSQIIDNEYIVAMDEGRDPSMEGWIVCFD